MLKKILLGILCIVFGGRLVFAEPVESNFIQNHTTEILTTIKTQREKVYNTLDLSEAQFQFINNIDTRRYEEIEPELCQLSKLVKDLNDLANSDDCTIKKVNVIKKEFKPIQNGLYKINQKYETELQTVLTKEQNSKYKKIRKQMRNDLKKRTTQKQ